MVMGSSKNLAKEDIGFTDEWIWREKNVHGSFNTANAGFSIFSRELQIQQLNESNSAIVIAFNILDSGFQELPWTKYADFRNNEQLEFSNSRLWFWEKIGVVGYANLYSSPTAAPSINTVCGCIPYLSRSYQYRSDDATAAVLLSLPPAPPINIVCGCIAYLSRLYQHGSDDATAVVFITHTKRTYDNTKVKSIVVAEKQIYHIQHPKQNCC